ncbi:MAG: hypothetical protein MIO92_13380, partial [Methanosarcinaceae archaeon]|nr:hypothetical protein [Methanosarcinaceae archaeon]
LQPRIATSHRVDRVEVFAVIDEADADVNQASELMFPDSMCPISEWWKRGREFGLGGCVVLSSLKPASKLVIQNSTMHLIFHTNDPESSLEASRTLMLDQAGPMMLNQLDAGECLVKQSHGWHHTYRGRIDYVPPCRTPVTEYDTHPYVPSKSLAELPHVQRAIKEICGKQQSEDKPKSNDKSQLTEWARQAMKIWAKCPYTPMARIFERIGPVTRKQQLDIRKLIEDKQWAHFEEPRIGRRNMLLMELSEQGYAAVGLPVPEGNKGRGKTTHRHFVQWIRSHLEQENRTVHLEWKSPGTNHPVDLVVPSEDGWTCFEVCVTALDNVTSHVEACFVDASQPAESLTIVAGTKKQLTAIKKEVESNLIALQHGSKIQYQVIEDYVPKEVSI